MKIRLVLSGNLNTHQERTKQPTNARDQNLSPGGVNEGGLFAQSPHYDLGLHTRFMYYYIDQ